VTGTLGDSEDHVQPRHRALVIEDESDVSDLIVLVLEQAGLEVRTAALGSEALALVRETNPDLITLDLNLPDMDGTDICRQVREFSDAYIIMITARSDEIDRLVGLELGADDYLAKPVSTRELRARAAALLRRPRLGAAGLDVAALAPPVAVEPAPEPESGIDAGAGLELLPARRQATLHGEPLPLTPAEFDILQALVSRPGEAWERGEIVRQVWQGEFIESDFLVDVHVANLRRKLRRAGGTAEWIRTAGGVGYAFERP
jgi:DNA-binding response OmpR family regulator